MSLAKTFERFDARERRMLTVLIVIAAVLLIVLIPVGVSAILNPAQARTEALRNATTEIVSSQAAIAKADQRRRTVTERYARPAPPLAGLLDGLAKESGIEIPESQDRPVVPHGKRYEERSIRLQLRKVGLGNLARFLEKVEKTGHPIVLSKLTIRKRLTEADSYDVELIVSAYDRKELPKSEASDADKPAVGSSSSAAKEAP